MRPGDFQRFVVGPPMAPREPSPPKTDLEMRLEAAIAALEDLAARYASCTIEWRRGRLANELAFQRRTVERLEAERAAEVTK